MSVLSITAFAQENEDWLEDYALFTAIKQNQEQKSWQDWETGYKKRSPKALEKARKEFAEDIAFAMERLFATGAYDVYTQPVGMKKNRPGILLSVLCSPSEKDSIIRAIFKYTTTNRVSFRENIYLQNRMMF